MKQLKWVLPQLYIRTHGLQMLRFEIIQLSELNASMTNQNLEEFVIKLTDLAHTKRVQLTTNGILLRT